MDLRSARPDDLRALGELAAPLQRRPDRHIAYLAIEAPAIAAGLADDVGDWTGVSAVAVDGDGTPLGWLVGEVDRQIGRVWWHGPVVADTAPWAPTATALYRFAAPLLPPAIEQEELAIDGGFTDLVEWAVGFGFSVDPGSAILTLPIDTDPAGQADAGPAPTIAGAPAVLVGPATEGDRDAVAAIHDAAFPGTHATGHQLAARVDDRHHLLVARLDGRAAGYAAVEHTVDGEAYLDFLGVDPAQRRRGVGRALVDAAIAQGRRWGCRRVALTVRETNEGARALYRSLGFTEERILVPLRKGFRLT